MVIGFFSLFRAIICKERFHTEEHHMALRNKICDFISSLSIRAVPEIILGWVGGNPSFVLRLWVALGYLPQVCPVGDRCRTKICLGSRVGAGNREDTLKLQIYPVGGGISDKLCPRGGGWCQVVSPEGLGGQKICCLPRIISGTAQIFQNSCTEPLGMHALARMRKPTVWRTETEIVAVSKYFHGTIFEFTPSFPVGSGWRRIIIPPMNIDHHDSPYDRVHIGGYYVYSTIQMETTLTGYSNLRAVPEIILGGALFFQTLHPQDTHGVRAPRPPVHISALINLPHYGSNMPWPLGQVTPPPLGHINKAPSPPTGQKSACGPFPQG